MITVHTIAELRQHIRQARQQGKTIGFVPTMGNLHSGHISLIERAREDGCFSVASIFVNPLQFNDKSDLSRYPRTLPEDQQKLEAAQCDLLFAPDVDEMYPASQSEQSIVHVPVVSEGLCGGTRPGHFDGVSTVVSKLFNQVQPDNAYFGEKDFQQVAVIKKMVTDLCMPVAIIPVPTARADDGLALSSRNGYLSDDERARAPALFRALAQARDTLVQGGELDAAISAGCLQLTDAQFGKIDYFELRRGDNLQPVSNDQLAQLKQQATPLVLLAAAFLGSARLIDNLQFKL